MKNLLVLLLVMLCFSCTNKKQSEIVLLDAKAFSTVVDGKNVALYTLKNENGMTMQVTNFGGRVVSLWVPGKNGKFDDVVLGHTGIEQYIHPEGERFIGCVVGRYANRIAKGQFKINGKTYQLPLNNNGQSLHGGLKGLDLVVWNVDTIVGNAIQLSYISPDGEEGYPGTVRIKMVYTLTSDNELKIAYAATTDKPTVINLSHHGFFNLKGEGNGTINDHILTIYADHYTPVDSVLIPTGEIAPVKDTPFDFRNPTAIGARVDADHPQLKNGLGYDHNWVLKRATEQGVELAASVYEPVSGRLLEVFTNQPGLQFYGGNFFDGNAKGKYGKTQNYREAIALETQHFPDSPNRPGFPSTRLNPGEFYTHTCIYKFSTK
jgi:aldose 1-epimerase